MSRFVRLLLTTGVIGAGLTIGVFGLHGQQPAPQGVGGKGGGKGGVKDKAPTTPAPRRPDGKIDFSGNWAPNAIQQNINLASKGGEPKMAPWAKEAYDKHKTSLSKEDPEARCLPPGVPRMSTTPYPWSMTQTDNLLVIVYEGGAHIWRKIFLDGRKHDPRAEETWLGDSVGHWEGNDTLVVETVGQNDKTWLDEDGHVHTKNMVVTERFTRQDMGHMTIEHTIHDPEAYPEDWKFTTNPTLLDGELIEYICQENNKDVEHLFGK